MVLEHPYRIYMSNRPYQQLIAWQEAHKLCLHIYKLTKNFPMEERFGLSSQMRRSSASVPTNLAEGNGKTSRKEEAHFFEISLCSLDELHYQVLLSKDLSYISKLEYENITAHINRTGFLIRKLRSSIL